MQIVVAGKVTCPWCGFVEELDMPTNACHFLHECSGCKTVLSPKSGDCCIFCSFGDVPCPPKQMESWESGPPVSASEPDVPTRLLVATRNPGKSTEFERLLGDVSLEITSLDEVGCLEEPEETGDTFEENAVIKARFYCERTGLVALSDDSGLEVDALRGEPGVRSARYGGPGYTDEGRVDLLLRNLKDVDWEDRTGRFRCVIAIVWPDGEVRTVDGTMEGIIQYEPKGDNGFGYDPVFYLPHLGKTTGELSMADKNELSHRGKAAQKAVALLQRILSDEGPGG